MTVLSCAVCSGILSMDRCGELAYCKSCEMGYTKEHLKIRALEVSDIKVIQEQIRQKQELLEERMQELERSPEFRGFCAQTWKRAFLC